jgi:hypothetical protein
MYDSSQSQSYFTTGGLPPISRLSDKPLETHDHNFFFQLNICGYSNILSDTRIGLSFIIAAGPRQRSHSQVRVPWDS